MYEALFICLVIISCFYARKRNWLVASVAGFFATLTKILGGLVAVPIVIEYFNVDLYSVESIRKSFYRLKEIRSDFLYVFIVPLAVLCYMLYLHYLIPFTVHKTLAKHSTFQRVCPLNAQRIPRQYANVISGPPPRLITPSGTPSGIPYGIPPRYPPFSHLNWPNIGGRCNGLATTLKAAKAKENPRRGERRGQNKIVISIGIQEAQSPSCQFQFGLPRKQARHPRPLLSTRLSRDTQQHELYT